MPTRRIFMLAFLVTIATETAIHGIARPWLARRAQDNGIVGDLAQAGQVLG